MSEVDQLRGENERLRDRVEELGRVLGVDQSLTSRLRDVFGLEAGLAPILGMLMKRAFVSHSSLYTVLYAGRPECDWPEAKVMDVQICKLRRKLRKHGVTIETRWGEGWRMSIADKARVRTVLDKASASVEAPALSERRSAFMEGV
jgi:DNA-binding response OmpR family regulator